MAGNQAHYDVEQELEHLRDEVRVLRQEQEEQKKQQAGKEQPTKEQGEKRPAEENRPEEPPKSHVVRNLVIATVAIVILVAGLIWWLHARKFESTDDAQVDGHVNAITARVAGTITGVYAEENQTVQQGQLLVQMDPNDYRAATDLARGQLAQSQAQAEAEQPNVPVTRVTNQTTIANSSFDIARTQAGLSAAERNYAAAEAKVREAQANNAKAQADVERYRPLADKDEIPRQQFDQVVANALALSAAVAASQATAQAAQQQIDQSRAELSQAQQRSSQAKENAPSELAIRQANVAARRAASQAARAQLEQATLNLSYTKILAPVGGIVAKRIAEVGQHVAAGQEVFLISQLNDLWVTANFKETQLLRMQPQQGVSIHVDALDKDFNGYVENLPAASGSTTSLLPPENATGNFVKVVQRLPVRIRFNNNQAGLDRLRPGMSVEPNVRVR